MNDASSWSDIAQSHIEGALLQCRKGEWMLDDKPIETGVGGVRIVLLMTSAEVGEVRFDDDGNKVGERVGRIEDGFIPDKQLEPDWSPSTKIVAVGLSPDVRGQVMTFRSSSWGGRFAFNTLIGTYCRFRQQQFPAVYLDTTKKTRNGNVVIDPLFIPDSWLPRESFETPGALPEPPEQPRLTDAARAAYGSSPKEAPATLARKPVPVTSGIKQLEALEMPPAVAPHTVDDGYAGVDPSDAIPF